MKIREKCEKFQRNAFLFQAVSDRAITRFRANLVFIGFRAVGQANFDFAFAPVVILIRRSISDDVLRAEFFGNFLESAFEFEHIAGEKDFAAGFFG
jgi:hypothetical protein